VFRVLGHRELDRQFVLDVVNGALSGVGVAKDGFCAHAG
jgi:hypothetical protein